MIATLPPSNHTKALREFLSTLRRTKRAPTALELSNAEDRLRELEVSSKKQSEPLQQPEIPVVEENRILREALFPRPEIKDCSPLILYFGDKQERDEFIAAVAEAKPNMRSYKV